MFTAWLWCVCGGGNTLVSVAVLPIHDGSPVETSHSHFEKFLMNCQTKFSLVDWGKNFSKLDTLFKSQPDFARRHKAGNIGAADCAGTRGPYRTETLQCCCRHGCRSNDSPVYSGLMYLLSRQCSSRVNAKTLHMHFTAQWERALAIQWVSE